ncbi:MAG: ATP-dependent protease subunit HslV [Chloroflexota bacterium]|nr:ATP-dependent protease subunit HslV [Chloroflexota bacterium]
MSHTRPPVRATTILAVLRDGRLAVAGDGQVTVGDTVLKHKAVKIRSLYQDQVLAGFAGAVADALTLFDKFEGQLETYHGNLRRAAVELAKQWRTDRYLRPLEAQLLVGDSEQILLINGDGDVIEPDERVAAIGSGGDFALAAAQALLAHTDLASDQIAEASMRIASNLCIYTNEHITMQTIEPDSADDGRTEGRATGD